MSGHILLLAAVSFGQPAGPVPDLATLQRQAVEARMAIRTLHMKLTIDREWHDRYGVSGKSGKVLKFEIWQDADHYRADIFTEGGNKKQDMAVGRRHVYCKNCERPGHVIEYFTDSLVSLSEPGSRYARELFGKTGQTFDPRYLGYTHDTFLNTPRPVTAKNLGLAIVSPERTRPTVEAAMVDGEPAWLVKSTWLRSGAIHRIYILPNKSGSVGLIEGSGKSENYTFRGRYRSELEQDARTGIWFPKKFVREFFENDVLRDLDTVTVHLREFNQPIDPAVFTLAGIGIPDGTEIYIPEIAPPGKPWPRRQFQGGQIVPYKEEVPAVPPPPAVLTQPRPVDSSVVPGRFRLWYAAAAVLFVGAAVLLIRRAVRRAT